LDCTFNLDRLPVAFATALSKQNNGSYDRKPLNNAIQGLTDDIWTVAALGVGSDRRTGINSHFSRPAFSLLNTTGHRKVLCRDHTQTRESWEDTVGVCVCGSAGPVVGGRVAVCFVEFLV
jgi:hypothetical protein